MSDERPMNKLDTMLQVGRTFGMRDAMLRLQYELQRGSGLMSWRMRSVQGWDSWVLNRIAPGVQAEEMRAARRDGTRRFFFSDVRTLASSARKIIGTEGEASVLAEAENILAGNLPFLGALSFHCGFPPRWFHNPVTGQSVSPQQPWTQMRFASPVYGDLKFILEPSRFLFVYPLVRAYALSGDERFPQAFWNAIENWAHHNPPMAGPLWICGQESSLRILAWSFALHGFIHSVSTTPDRVVQLVSMIAAHAWRTARTLGYARSQRSNHLISEAVGLWTAGTLYPELREAQVWQKLGAHFLREAVLDQITPQGVSQQHSFNYQRMILHLLLWTLRLAEIHDAPLHQSIRERTEAALDFMRPWVDPISGLAPNYGSDDGSLIFPLAPASYRDFRPLLQLGAAVLNRQALQPGPWDEAPLWFGMQFGEEFGARPAPARETISHSSSDTGYFRLGDQKSWALIRAGQYARRPFQADQLHVDLWCNGINLARDPGTYLYNGPAPWNNGLAGTAVHNTVTIDHQDQMRRAGRFLWLDWAQATGRVYASPNHTGVDCFEGEHDGYKRLGVTHHRMVRWLMNYGWVIVDDIEGSGQHDARLHWLASDLSFEAADAPFQVIFNAGQSRIRWNIFSSVPGTPAIVRAGKRMQFEKMTSETSMPDVETQLLGWQSPTYGDLQPAVSLVYETRSLLPVRFITVILTDEACQLESRNNGMIISQHDSEIYRVDLSAGNIRTAKTQPNAPTA
jgi:Heparinase II/III-like protein/Heparinase II/III N-terminus